MAYADQLKLKHDQLKKIMAHGFDGLLNEDIVESSEKHGRHNYRTKCEFTIMADKSTGLVNVGFIAGDFRDNSRRVIPSTKCHHADKHAIAVADDLQVFIRTQSQLAPFVNDSGDCSGFWRMLIVRNHSDNQCMVIMMVSTKWLDAALLERVAIEKQLLTD